MLILDLPRPHCWLGQPRITWNGAVRQIEDVVIIKIQCSCQIWQEPRPPPPISSAASSTSSKGKTSARTTTPTPKSKKEEPNEFCKILKLEGTSVNSKTATADFNKHLTRVRNNLILINVLLNISNYITLFCITTPQMVLSLPNLVQSSLVKEMAKHKNQKAFIQKKIGQKKQKN